MRLTEGSFTLSVTQRCDDAGDTALIDIKRVAPKLVATPFSSESPDFNESCIASVDACDIALIEIEGNKEWLQNGVATHFGVTPLIQCEPCPKRYASVDSVLTLTIRVNGP